jgi:hypothetical protein
MLNHAVSWVQAHELFLFGLSGFPPEMNLGGRGKKH